MALIVRHCGLNDHDSTLITFLGENLRAISRNRGFQPPIEYLHAG